MYLIYGFDISTHFGMCSPEKCCVLLRCLRSLSGGHNDYNAALLACSQAGVCGVVLWFTLMSGVVCRSGRAVDSSAALSCSLKVVSVWC